MQDAVAEERNAERLPLEKFKEMQVLNLNHGKKTPDIAAFFHCAHSPAHEKRSEMAAVLFSHGQTATHPDAFAPPEAAHDAGGLTVNPGQNVHGVRVTFVRVIHAVKEPLLLTEDFAANGVTLSQIFRRFRDVERNIAL